MRFLLCCWDSRFGDISGETELLSRYYTRIRETEPLLISFHPFAAFPSLKLATFCRKSMSSVLLARTGRHQQRYQDHFRLVAGKLYWVNGLLEARAGRTVAALKELAKFRCLPWRLPKSCRAGQSRRATKGNGYPRGMHLNFVGMSGCAKLFMNSYD
uniref:Uncharacterized protein LOC105060363 isoform X3 n=1 Tax=Elaeis guineensis var. tenera TaxID=51953 RepID=A0A6J0PAF4_ELAGV|nr:uncharacterized protein LOC105060363 isoform X3 [Elaeis guineensis]